MKFLKIVFALAAAFWALALVPNLLFWFSHQGEDSLAFSHLMGVVVGMLITSAISIKLFRGASTY